MLDSKTSVILKFRSVFLIRYIFSLLHAKLFIDQIYVNRRTSRRTSGERHVKPRREFVNGKIVSYIQKHNKTVIPQMKTERKEKEKKEEKKRIEAKRKRFSSDSNPGPSTHRAKALPLGHVVLKQRFPNFIIKTFEPH